MGLYFEGDVLSVVEKPYEAGRTDNGRPFDAGISRTINVLNGADVLKIKAAKSLDMGDLDSLRTACGEGERVRARLDLDFAFGKLQAVSIAHAAV